MALYRRSETRVWWMDYTDAEGKRVRQSTGTENKQLAQELYDKTRAEVWECKRLGIKKDRLFSEAVRTFLLDKKQEKLRSLADYESRSEFWVEEFQGKYLRQITKELIVQAIKKREGANSHATLNRYLAVLKAVLRHVSTKYGWLKRDDIPTFFFYEEPKGRTRWLEPEEIARLLNALPGHWRDVAEFSFATGLRQSNVLNLRWSQINLTRRTVTLDGKEMKNGRDHGIPLNDAAVEALRRCIGRHHTYVFFANGKPPCGCPSKTWKAATKKAGIEDFRPHDMRHTWASMLAQQGVPDGVIQKLGAWETPRMVDRYRHHSAASLAPYAAKVDEVMAGASHFASQQAHAPLKSVSP
jgi:integrase